MKKQLFSIAIAAIVSGQSMKSAEAVDFWDLINVGNSNQVLTEVDTVAEVVVSDQSGVEGIDTGTIDEPINEPDEPLPTDEYDPNNNPFTTDAIQAMLFDESEPSGNGMQRLIVDGTDYADTIFVEWTPSGALLINGTASVNGVIVDEIQITFDPANISRVTVFSGNSADDISNQTDMRFEARLGEGNDFVFAGFGEASVMGGPGDDFFNATSASSLHGNGQDGHDTVWGSEFDDVIIGGPGDDELHGFEGNDFIKGDGHSGKGGPDEFGFEDLIFGGKGNDVLWGGTSVDIIHGGLGDDEIDGFGVYPHPFLDSCLTDDDEEDLLFGDEGADTFKVHLWRFIRVGYSDYPLDFNKAEDQLETENHWW